MGVVLSLLFFISFYVLSSRYSFIGKNTLLTVLSLLFISWYIVPTWNDTFRIWGQIVDMMKYKVMRR